MSDHCHFCTIRGHFRACEETDCNIHESWYVRMLKADRKRLQEALQEIASGRGRGLVTGALSREDMQEIARVVLEMEEK